MNGNSNESKNIRYAELNDFHEINEIADQAQWSDIKKWRNDMV